MPLDERRIPISLLLSLTALVGAGALALSQSEISPSQENATWAANLFSPAEPEDALIRNPPLVEVELNCKGEPAELPPHAAQVRFRAPRCPGVHFVSVRNEANQLESVFLHEAKGSSISELIGLKPGDNQLTLITRRTGAGQRQPASVGSMTLYRRPQIKHED